MIHRPLAALATLLSISSLASGQFLGGPLDGLSFSGSTTLCNQTLEDANTTGLYSWNPNVAQFSQDDQPNNDSGSTLPVSWLVTVDETTGSDNASVQWSLWYSTNGANYSYDIGLGYDVCAFAMLTTTLNTLYRAQDDNGDCLTALDQSCVDDVESLAKQYAYEAVIDPVDLTVRKNLTKNSIYDVCEDVRVRMLDNFPSSCKVFFNESLPLNISGSGLTGANYSYLYDQCSISDSQNNETFYNIATYTKYTLDNPSIATNWYTGLNWLVLPALLIFLPTANSNAPSYIEKTKAKLQCLRANNVNAGSEKVIAAPAPTPLGGGGLSGGAIAGVVIGVLAGVAIIAGAAFFVWRRRRRSSKQLDTFNADQKGDGEGTIFAAAKDGHAMSMPEQKRVEAEDTHVKELSPDNEVACSGTEMKPAELSGGNQIVEKEAEMSPVELLADVPKYRS